MIVNTASYTIVVLGKSSERQMMGEGEMNENRSSGSLRCSWDICTDWNSDFGHGLLAMVCRTNTRLWTNGLRRSRSRVDIRGLESNAAGNLWRAADGHIPTSGYARGHCRRATSWSPGSGLQELSLGRHGLRWPALHSGPHHGHHSWNMGSATLARSLARGIENSQKLTLEIHLPVLRLHSSSVSTA